MSPAEIFLPAQSGYSRAIQHRNSRAKSGLLHSRFPQPFATMADSPFVRMVSGMMSRAISRTVSGRVSGTDRRGVLGDGDGSVAWGVATGVAPAAAPVGFTSGTTVDCTGSSP